MVNDLPLFEASPSLGKRLAYASLGELPTPVERLDMLAARVGAANLYIKRDDLSGVEYGGNKVRKLEFVLARAQADHRGAVITFGAVGSNHVLATAIYAQRLGLGCSGILHPQPITRGLTANLLKARSANARVYHCTSTQARRMLTAREFLYWTLRTGRKPLVIPLGGSSPLGVMGFVNAAFELKAQINAAMLPEPDVLYVTLGTMGTAAGLALGLRLAGLKTRIEAIRVVAPSVANEQSYRQLYGSAHALIAGADPALATEAAATGGNIELRHDFFGRKYALFTEEGMAAVRLMNETEGINLDGTYTGKTLAALIADAKAGKLKGKTVLFWNTYNSRDLKTSTLADYHELPQDFHSYFENPPQPLDT